MNSALYVVATPIGNLADITQRAVEVLSQVDAIAAEDTRHSQALLAHHGISRPLLAYHEHSDQSVTDRLAARVLGGERLALISDAGTPLLSDPGYRLVRAVQDAGGRVIPVPGASAAIAALSVAGLPSDRFSFEGFLPARALARRQRIGELAALPQTLILYEAPHRLLATLDDLVELLGPDREAALARELTKRFETIHRAALGALRDWVAADPNQQRGELVLLLGRAPAAAPVLDAPLAELLEGMAEHMPGKRAASLLARYTGLPRKQLYDHLVDRADD